MAAGDNASGDADNQQGSRSPALFAGGLTPQRLHAELLEADARETRAYLLGALRDGTFNREVLCPQFGARGLHPSRKFLASEEAFVTRGETRDQDEDIVRAPWRHGDSREQGSRTGRCGWITSFLRSLLATPALEAILSGFGADGLEVSGAPVDPLVIPPADLPAGASTNPSGSGTRTVDRKTGGAHCSVLRVRASGREPPRLRNGDVRSRPRTLRTQ
jgi:hypothetical protein